MIRLFLPLEKITLKQISINGEEARHLALVLRAKPGDSITVLDGSGYKYDCKLISVHKKEVRAEITGKAPYSAESPVSTTLAQGISKGDRMDFIIQKSTELGISKIIPLITDRTQVRHTEKVERWRKIAVSASRQSGREKVPDITEPVNFKDFLNIYSPGTGIILSEEEKEQSLKKTLNDIRATKGVTLLVGPEGGFSKNEVSTAVQKGFISVTLGPRILRTETAPITALSIIQYELGDMG